MTRGWLVRAVVAGLVMSVAGFVPAQAAPARSGVVLDGHARFEVLTPTLIRLEYAGDDQFQDGTTFNVVNRNFPTPRYTTDVVDGWREIHTDQLVLRYREGSGPFTSANTAVTLSVAGRPVTANPTWPAAPGSCAFGSACQAEDGQLTGGESVNYDHTGYTGRGFAADYGQIGATDTWSVTGVPSAGSYPLQVRYANGGTVSRTFTVRANNTTIGQITLPPTASWDTWGTAAIDIPLNAGTDSVALTCASGDGCNSNLDSVAVTTPNAAYPTASAPPPVTQPGQLGGWTRGLDSYTNQAGTNVGDIQLHPGLLNQQGWSLLDDTYTALRNGTSWPTPRPDHHGAAYQDGYFFGYGHDYQQALKDLRALTGPSDMLPEWAFGVWFSEYNAFSTSDYENSLIPAFRSHNVPIDALVADTDWKSPQAWNGWNWNPSLFPDPQAFLNWAKQQGLNVTLNVHASIDASDPNFAKTQAATGNALQPAAQCFTTACYRFDWSNQAQANAYFALHQPFQQQGVAQWWLDWCCDDSVVDMPGLTPDSWINELYKENEDATGQRGFSLARIGSSFEDYQGAPASGPWGDHRSTVHFTGDTDPTWQSLAFEAQLAGAEASIGEPYVSEDIGSFKGKHPADDLYARWVQLGTFQPILRLHSDHGDRLPWQYGVGQQSATQALQLREALVPYTYTLGYQATQTGLPIVRPLYLDYPDQASAYANPGEYLYGPDVLVAPVTTPGQVATQTVWFPPGQWTDYFTGATFTGPSTATLNVPLNQMPVFVRAGGIVPEQPAMNHVGAQPVDPLALNVYAGGSGQFSLYEDAGQGSGYQQGQSAQTRIDYAEHGSISDLTVGAARGRFPGQLTSRAYQVHLVDVSAPQLVLANGRPLPKVAPNSATTGWWYDAATTTLHVNTPKSPTNRPVSIIQIGGHAVSRAQSAAVGLTLDPATPLSVNPGQTVPVTATVTNAGPGAITGTSATLAAPSGWTVTPSTPTAPVDVPAGGSATATWQVTAPAGTGAQAATLTATVNYTSASNGGPGQVSTSEGPPIVVPPVLDSVQPTSASAGTVVTITGSNFGATQGSSYLLFADGPISWGAPFDGATFQVDSWSDTKITFTVPEPSGTGGIWHVTPGTTATVDVNTAGGASANGSILITG
ncbi:MAG TPA: TIM-barrel domain-containing protein [Pseudonocardiaceae bacterium]|nr:TIM-barrel domain-containing protein [Pseudonocardiaceae bacterium]